MYGLDPGRDVVNATGWDKNNFVKSWNEMITEREFVERILNSTISYKFKRLSEQD